MLINFIDSITESGIENTAAVYTVKYYSLIYYIYVLLYSLNKI